MLIFDILRSKQNFKFTAAFTIALLFQNPAAYSEETDVNAATYTYKFNQYSLTTGLKYDEYNGKEGWHNSPSWLWKRKVYLINESVSARAGLGYNLDIGATIEYNSRRHLEDTHISSGRNFVNNKSYYLYNPRIYLGYGLNEIIKGPINAKISIDYLPNLRDGTYNQLGPAFHLSYPLNNEYKLHGSLFYIFNQRYDVANNKGFNIGIKNYSFTNITLDLYYTYSLTNSIYPMSSYDVKTVTAYAAYKYNDTFYIIPSVSYSWRSIILNNDNNYTILPSNRQTYSISLKQFF